MRNIIFHRSVHGGGYRLFSVFLISSAFCKKFQPVNVPRYREHHEIKCLKRGKKIIPASKYSPQIHRKYLPFGYFRIVSNVAHWFCYFRERHHNAMEESGGEMKCLPIWLKFSSSKNWRSFLARGCVQKTRKNRKIAQKFSFYWKFKIRQWLRWKRKSVTAPGSCVNVPQEGSQIRGGKGFWDAIPTYRTFSKILENPCRIGHFLLDRKSLPSFQPHFLGKLGRKRHFGVNVAKFLA